MKRTLVLLLGLVIVLSFALVACGDKASEGTTATTAAATETTAGTETTAAEATGGAIDWTEAVDYEGEEVTITGTVAAVSNLYEEKGIGKLLVRLGGDSKSDHFNMTFVLDPNTGAWPAYAAEYESMVAELVGKTVEVTGMVSLNSFESCYEVLMNDTDNNTIPDDAMTGTLVVK